MLRQNIEHCLTQSHFQQSPNAIGELELWSRGEKLKWRRPTVHRRGH